MGILHFFGQFRGELEVLALAKIHRIGEFFLKSGSTIKLFFLPQICSLLDCSWQIPEKKKKTGGHRARAHVRALMTQKSCTVELHIAVPRNCLKATSTLSRINLKTQLFFIRIGLPSTLKRCFRCPKTELFENALQSG